MYCASESEVAAESDSHIAYVTEFPLDGQKVGKSLGRMAVASVAGVDDRHAGYFRRGKRCSFYVMPHGDDISEAAHYPDSILHGLTLAY